MAAPLKYPIGLQSFDKIIEEGFVYLDKTNYIKELIYAPTHYFLSRPRRFGKSLFLSTLQVFFSGQRDLFKGLAIDTDDIDWTPRPVFMLSLNAFNPKSKDSIDDLFSSIFTRYENLYGKIEGIKDLPQRLENLIINAHEKTGRKVVVLVDEYDSPLLSTLDKTELNDYYRQTLKSVFSVLKSADQHIYLAFVTGVSRFSQTSLFSGANNLKDISFEDKYAALCGITEDELLRNLSAGINDLAQKSKLSVNEAFQMLKENYDGYHFSEECLDIYNPFSLLSALDSKKIKDYWFKSGTLTYLLEILKRENFFLPDLDYLETVESSLGVKESNLNNPIALLFESGYLTIKGYDEEKKTFLLGLPNKEVAESFSSALMPVYSGYSQYECENLITKMRSAVVDGKAEEFMVLLQTFLEGNPYGNTELAKRESYFKNNVYIVCRALGFLPRAEEQTCHSRMDVMLRTRRFVYIFELKTNGKVDQAMDQIQEKGYAKPYLYSGKTIIKIAANYSTTRNNIDSWTIDYRLSIIG